MKKGGIATDFVEIRERQRTKNSPIEIYPEFITKKSKDLMVRGGDFYAIWNESRGCWSTDLDDVVNSIDAMMVEYKEKLKEKYKEDPKYEKAVIKYMKFSSSGSIDQWWKYVKSQLRDNYHPLDQKLVFLNDPPKREDYSSKRLSYDLKAGDYSAWDELVGTLYEPEERHKIEWAIGAVVSGDSKEIQKFLVLYGDSGTGKSTILNIICELFKGYYAMFIAKELASSSSDFSLEAFKDNPLVAIQQDGDLSHIEDNTKLNSLVSHEEMVVNMKFAKKFTTSFNAMLFMGTNKPVKITDSKSGIIRRLIDIKPSGKLIRRSRYNQLMKQIRFELGAIAYHCLEVYKDNPNAYDDYVPITMIGATNDFYIFLQEQYDYILKQESVTLNDMYNKYLIYCSGSGVTKPYQRKAVKEELKNYFKIYRERKHTPDGYLWNVYEGFKIEKFNIESQMASDEKSEKESSWLQFNTTESLLDKAGSDWPAQAAIFIGDRDQPGCAWDKCKTVLADIQTAELHYVRVPENLVVIDFDLKDPVTGEKSYERNLEAASKWPKTYAELSKSGKGIHLHYFYTGDVSVLDPIYAEDIEVKVFPANKKSALRRKLTRCNSLPITTITSGLPVKKEATKTVNEYEIKNEAHLKAKVEKALRKEIPPYATKTCMDYIKSVTDQAYNSGMVYDISELESQIMFFAASSTNNSLYCRELAGQLHLKSEEQAEWVESKYEEYVFFDFEVFPNLVVLCVKPLGKDPVALINPTPAEVSEWFRYRMIGFNCRDYDNHIAWALMQGDSPYELFIRSQNIINAPKGKNNWKIGGAYNLSYTDVYDFCSTKQSLKKWEIELGIHHQELGLAWDKPVPQNLWPKVAEYCKNDVIATEATFLANEADFKARQILVDLANSLVGPGSCVNDTTNTLTTKLIVGNVKNPQVQFIKPDLTKEFPGYEFNPFGFHPNRYMLPVKCTVGDNPALYEYYEKFTVTEPGNSAIEGAVDKYLATKDETPVPGKQYYRNTMISGKSFYKGFDPGEGGFVFARPGMYYDLECYDSASHHPSTIIAENGFGPFTENFKMLLDIRLHIKHKDYDWVRGIYNGILAPYLTSDEDAKQLSQALKIAINSVYGLTAAHFDNKLHDPRNNDNWVAKRGALFMIDLMLEVEKQGYKVVHVKTDSIKIEKPDQKIFDFVFNFGKQHGYTFEVEHKFDRLCLVNDAVYICKYTNDPANGKSAGKWEGTGDQFKQKSSPYTFKTLFSHDLIEFKDLCVTQTVKVGLGIYLDMDESLPDDTALVSEQEKLLRKWKKVGYELNADNDLRITNGEAPTLSDVPSRKIEQYTKDVYHLDYVRLAELEQEIKKCHDYHFVGKAGLFCPIRPGMGGGRLVRDNKGKFANTAGSTGYRWLEAERVKELHMEDCIDLDYFEEIKNKAIDTINLYGDFETFANN